MRCRPIYLVVLLCALLVLIFGRSHVRSLGAKLLGRGKKSVEDRLKEFQQPVQQRLEPHFQRAGVPYPPKDLAFIGLKDSAVLQVYAAGNDQRFRWIVDYPILAASGALGPKVKEGDMQVPEGIYRIESLNPNSLYHLSLRVNYPNSYDREKAKQDKRTNLGGDIMIHGKRASIGCLAMGDPAAEDLFITAARTGIERIQVIICPTDLRKNANPTLPAGSPAWCGELYDSLRREMQKFPLRG